MENYGVATLAGCSFQGNTAEVNANGSGGGFVGINTREKSVHFLRAQELHLHRQ